jgi:DNA polymerase III sliding clamp (beta) subunit (PCNA family)
MATSQLTKQETVTLDAALFYDLVLGTSLMADSSKDAIDKLGSIYLSIENSELKAVATDRYRLISGSVAIEVGQELSQTQVRLADVKRILALLKPYTGKNKVKRDVTISRVGDIVSLSVAGDSISVMAGYEKMPEFKHMLTDTYAPISEFNLSLDLIASFSKVPSALGAATKLGFTADNKPVQIVITHDLISWHGLLMPMRVAK